MTTTFTSDPPERTSAERVAAYATVDAASLAINHLVELGYDEEAIGIAPRGFHVADEHQFRDRLAAGLRRGLVVGVAIATTTALVSIAGLDAVLDTLIPTILAGAALGLLGGIVLAVAAQWRARQASFGPRPERLVADRFAVVVANDAARADHDLAGWWDSSAPPARRI